MRLIIAALGITVITGALDARSAEPSPICWTAARRVVTIMIQVAAENNLTIVAPVSRTELEGLLRKNAQDLEARGACEIIETLSDSLLREMVRASLKGKES